MEGLPEAPPSALAAAWEGFFFSLGPRDFQSESGTSVKHGSDRVTMHTDLSLLLCTPGAQERDKALPISMLSRAWSQLVLNV